MRLRLRGGNRNAQSLLCGQEIEFRIKQCRIPFIGRCSHTRAIHTQELSTKPWLMGLNGNVFDDATAFMKAIFRSTKIIQRSVNQLSGMPCPAIWVATGLAGLP